MTDTLVMAFQSDEVVLNSGPLRVVTGGSQGPAGRPAIADMERFYISRGTTRRPKRALLSIVYDDNSSAIYSNAWPVHKSEGVPGAFYVATGKVQAGDNAWGTSVTFSQLREMDGFAQSGKISIQSHTHSHVDLTTLTLAQATTDIALGVSDLISEGIYPRHFAHPFNASNVGIRNILQGYFRSGAGSGAANDIGTTNPYYLNRTAIDAMTVAAVKLLIDASNAGQKWLILLMHGLDPSKVAGPALNTVMSPTELTQIIQYAKGLGVEVVDLDEGLRTFAPEYYQNDGTTEEYASDLISSNGGTLTGPLLLSLGTVGAPGVGFAGDANTGMWSPGADTLAWSTGGVERLRVDSSGNLVKGSPIALAINASATIAGFQTHGIASADSSWGLFMNANNASGPAIVIIKSRGAAVGSTTIVQSGDQFGSVSFRGYDGTNPIPGAQITAASDGTPGTNDMPGRLMFSTTPDGAAATVERVRIDNAGRVIVGGTASIATISTLEPRLQLHGTAGDSAGFGFYNWGNVTGGGHLLASKSRGGTIGTRGIVQSGDSLGVFIAAGDDGANFIQAGEIRILVDGTPGTNDMPGRITMSVTPDGASASVEAIRISNTGAVSHRNNAQVIIDANSHHILRAYTVGTVPSAAVAGQMIYVSDGTANKRQAVSDGTNWRWPDGAIVS